MQKVRLQNQQIKYCLKRSFRARRMRLAVFCDGNLVVTAPFSLTQDSIEKFIIQKSAWILKKLNYFKKFKGNIIYRKKLQGYKYHQVQALNLPKNG